MKSNRIIYIIAIVICLICIVTPELKFAKDQAQLFKTAALLVVVILGFKSKK